MEQKNTHPLSTDGEDFDDMLTDEHLGVSDKRSGGLIETFLEWFPDPLIHCIGFTILNADNDRLR